MLGSTWALPSPTFGSFTLFVTPKQEFVRGPVERRYLNEAARTSVLLAFLPSEPDHNCRHTCDDKGPDAQKHHLLATGEIEEGDRTETDHQEY